MSDVDSGIDLKFKIRDVHISPDGATFIISSGYYLPGTPPLTWVEVGSKSTQVPVADVNTIMVGIPDGILSRREDMLKVWSDYFIARGDIQGTLVASLGV